MSIVFKMNVLKELKDKGFSTYLIRKEKFLSESTVTKLRNDDTSITLNNLDTICELLECQPADIIEYVPNKAE